ncbi:hypothetical protein HC762_01140 [bacterium]|nr:hypothetical protein [bacterium]
MAGWLAKPCGTRCSASCKPFKKPTTLLDLRISLLPNATARPEPMVTMDPAALPFDSDAMVRGLVPWVTCESPTFDAGAVARMMDMAAMHLAELGAIATERRRGADEITLTAIAA